MTDAGIANLGDLALRQGDYARAIPLFEEALGISRGLENADGIAGDLHNLAFSLYLAGRSEEAVAAAKESLALAHEIDGVIPLVFGLILLASVASHRGNDEVGARLLGAAEILRERIGLDVTGAEGVLLGNTHAELRGALGEEAYETTLAEGKRMSLARAVDYALEN